MVVEDVRDLKFKADCFDVIVQMIKSQYGITLEAERDKTLTVQFVGIAAFTEFGPAFDYVLQIIEQSKRTNE